LEKNPVPVDNYGPKGFVSDLSNVIRGLRKETVKPNQFVSTLLTVAPEFGPVGDQQDAEECWQKLVSILDKVITIHDNKKHKEVSLMDHLFEIQYYDTLTCPELPD